MLSSAKIVERTNKIIEIVWDAKALPENIDSVTKQVQTLAQELGDRFDVIVDMRAVKAFLPESQKKLVEHQRALKEYGMQRAAVVVAGSITKLQLGRTARQSEHITESHWESYDEALNFLKNSSVNDA